MLIGDHFEIKLRRFASREVRIHSWMRARRVRSTMSSTPSDWSACEIMLHIYYTPRSSRASLCILTTSISKRQVWIEEYVWIRNCLDCKAFLFKTHSSLIAPCWHILSISNHFFYDVFRPNYSWSTWSFKQASSLMSLRQDKLPSINACSCSIGAVLWSEISFGGLSSHRLASRHLREIRRCNETFSLHGCKFGRIWFDVVIEVREGRVFSFTSSRFFNTLILRYFLMSFLLESNWVLL